MQQLVDNRYRLQQPLGSGGMADVFLAHDDVLDRDVALKVMSGRYAADDEFVERFKREAQSAAALSHPNIVSIFDRGVADDGTYYIAMEYLPGGTLKDRILKRGALPPRTAAAVALQIAEALRAAHDRDVIHRDIKPHNILITTSGDVKVTDFGIARAASSSTMTRTGHILGTAHYISPEQAMGEPVGPASDLYSLGVVLYEMLTGEMPFDADTPLGIAMKHVNGHVVPPQILNQAVPDGINAVTVRLLAKNPNDRYADDAGLIEDLERVTAGLDPSGATTELMTGVVPAATTRLDRPAPPQSVRRNKKRRRWAPLLLALLAFLILAPLAWAGYNALQQEPQARQPPPRIAVPDLTNSTLAEAEGRVGDDFEIVREGERDVNRPADTVLEQEPEDGELEQGSKIGVIVASGQNGVPETTGDTRAAAQRALEDAGFEVRVQRRESPARDEGLVTGQNPSGGAGAVAELDSEVEITLGAGPDAVPVPSVIGNDVVQAEEILAGADLGLGAVVEEYSDTVPEGSIISQDPVEGEELEPGGVVGVTVSLGVQQVEIPEVYGVTLEDAQASLDNLGINSIPREVPGDEAEGIALETDPGAGEFVDPNSTVTIYYSAGPPEPTAASPEPTTASPSASASAPASAAPSEGDGAGDANGNVNGDAPGDAPVSVPQNVQGNAQENVQENENVPGNGVGGGNAGGVGIIGGGNGGGAGLSGAGNGGGGNPGRGDGGDDGGGGED